MSNPQLEVETPALVDPFSAASLAAKLTHEIPYCPHAPHPAQERFLLDFGQEALYGGAAGGGKSDAILMAALQFIDIPGYAAILFRKSFRDLDQPDALMTRARGWLAGTGARWDNVGHTWRVPGGGSLTFAYLARVWDHLQYQGAAYNFVGFDELTQHSERDYTYLFSRVRRMAAELEGRHGIPSRVRATTNPGGPGHEWVHARFVGPYRAWQTELAEWREQGRTGPQPARPQRMFYPARLGDNPSLDRADYLRQLAELDPTTRAQLLRGDWDIRPAGRMFRRGWFQLIDYHVSFDGLPTVRYWDLAATDPEPGKDPDYTAGCLLTFHPQLKRYIIRDMQRFRASPATVEARIKRTAAADSKRVVIYMEQEMGASGKTVIRHFRDNVLNGYSFYGDLPSGKKVDRAMPVAAQADAGNVFMQAGGPWIDGFLNEISVFPDVMHDDQVDALSGAMASMMKRPMLVWQDRVNSTLMQENPWAM